MKILKGESCVFEHNPILKDGVAAWHDEIHEHLRHMLKFSLMLCKEKMRQSLIKSFTLQKIKVMYGLSLIIK